MKAAARNTASAAWETTPDWIQALALECDKPGNSQRKVAALLGVSATTVNLLLKNRYAPRDHADMEARVRAILMVSIIPCPTLGLMGRDDCREVQARPLITCSPISIQQYKACRDGCRFFETKEEI